LKTSGAEPASASPSESKPSSIKSSADVLIAEGDITNRAYVVLGEIEVTINKTTIFHADPTKELVNARLQEEAAKLGADAVLLVRYGTVGVGLFSWGSLEGRGRAVVFKN